MVTQYLAEGLSNLGHEVKIVTSLNTDNTPVEMLNNVKIIRVDLATKYGFPVGNKKLYRDLIVKESKISDVMINVCTQSAFTDVLLKRIDEIKCLKVLYLHGMYDFSWKPYSFHSISSFLKKIWKLFYYGFYFKRYKKSFQNYDMVTQLHGLCTGYQFFKDKYGIDSEIIGNACDEYFYTGTREISAEKYAICVANYFYDKNQEFVLNAFYQSKTSQRMKLIFIGGKETKYLDTLRRLNKGLEKKHGLYDQVVFLVNIDRKKTMDLIKGATMYLFGSNYEMYPISIVESMASGVPFISTDVGCVRGLPGGFVVKNIGEMSYFIDLLFSDPIFNIKLGELGNAYSKVRQRESAKITQLNELLKKLKDEKE